jgi:adenylate kinase
MNQRIVAVTGISGVGKTTLLRRLSDQFSFQHLQASTLIKTARSRAASISSTDELRSLGIADNQTHLVEQFRKEVDAAAELVAIDAHTLVELPQRTELIEPSVFKALDIGSMLFLTDDAGAIAQRRHSDSARTRPLKEAGEIAALQLQAETQAKRICNALVE